MLPLRRTHVLLIVFLLNTDNDIMAKDRIKLMISSRCSDQIRIGTQTMRFTELREKVLAELDKLEFLGRNLFDIEISEYFTEALDDTSWEDCLIKIRESDLILIWFTGHEGYKDAGKSIGICYAEYLESLQSNPSRVYLLDFREYEILDAKGNLLTNKVKTESPFAKAVQQKDKWLNKNSFTKVKDLSELSMRVTEKCKIILREAILRFVFEGSKSFRINKGLFGEGLKWSKLNHRFRNEAMVHYLSASVKSFLEQDDFKQLEKSFKIYAIPDAMSVAEAREMVGRPFLMDHKEVKKIKLGPIHLIGVYKNATESQIRDTIGHQEVAIIQDGFGYYVWDLINHNQLIYLTNCKDPQITIMQVDAFFTWLRVNDETTSIIDRAERRFKILKEIDKQKLELKGV